ncbi:hypothetical protein Vadar_003297 [Vaccinium darrowii]|uniref:Uncharacterized protein n=1 Tax=Vaccinium darrowii TaxID=229202 RepID=A0ACB7WXC9_9ERIC|nr:hypothetical protein Vadar_003297 [Vaccinium darrowii]
MVVGFSPGVCQNCHKNSEILGRTFDARELMLLREMEKNKIREGIIQQLKAAVIREMMMEGEIESGCEGRGLSLKDSLVPNAKHDKCKTVAIAIPFANTASGRRRKGKPPRTPLPSASSPTDTLTLVHPEVQGYGFGERQIELIRQQQIDIVSASIDGFLHQCFRIVSIFVHWMKQKSEAPITELLDGTPLNKNADNSEALVEEAEYSKDVDYGVKLEVGLKNTNDGAAASENEITYSNGDFTFLCNTCKYITNNEQEITVHRMGKPHMTLWQASGGGVTDNHAG